jgi:hypothetical protein
MGMGVTYGGYLVYFERRGGSRIGGLIIAFAGLNLIFIGAQNLFDFFR